MSEPESRIDKLVRLAEEYEAIVRNHKLSINEMIERAIPIRREIDALGFDDVHPLVFLEAEEE